MIRCLVACMLASLLAIRCSPNEPPRAELSEEDQIREVVFRYQFEFNASGLGKGAGAYYLGLGHGDDPSAELMARFEGHAPPVKPLSASELEPGTSQVVDRETGLPGLAFLITDIRWQGDHQVEVDGGYEEASESAAGSTFHLLKENGQWRVSGSQMHWIK
jgi:hypothetical protein